MEERGQIELSNFPRRSLSQIPTPNENLLVFSACLSTNDVPNPEAPQRMVGGGLVSDIELEGMCLVELQAKSCRVSMDNN